MKDSTSKRGADHTSYHAEGLPFDWHAPCKNAPRSQAPARAGAGTHSGGAPSVAPSAASVTLHDISMSEVSDEEAASQWGTAVPTREGPDQTHPREGNGSEGAAPSGGEGEEGKAQHAELCLNHVGNGSPGVATMQDDAGEGGSVTSPSPNMASGEASFAFRPGSWKPE